MPVWPGKEGSRLKFSPPQPSSPTRDSALRACSVPCTISRLGNRFPGPIHDKVCA